MGHLFCKLGHDLSEEELDAVFTSLDLDGDGTVSGEGLKYIELVYTCFLFVPCLIFLFYIPPTNFHLDLRGGILKMVCKIRGAHPIESETHI